MSELVKRLHMWGNFGYGHQASKDMHEAADRIEHLNTLLKRLEGSLRASKPLFGAQHFRSVHVGDDLIEDIYAALEVGKKDE